MGRMTQLNPTHIRIQCECGEFIHEVKQGTDGELVYEEFHVSGKSKPVPSAPTELPKKKKFKNLFEREDE